MYMDENDKSLKFLIAGTLILFLLALHSAGCSSPPHAVVKVNSPGEVFRNVTDSSVIIDFPDSMGSGTIIYADTRSSLVLTCAHVVVDMDAPNNSRGVFVVKTAMGGVFRAQIESADVVNDLALVVAFGDIGIKPLEIATREPALYEQLYLMGSPLSIPHVASQAFLSSKSIVSEVGQSWLLTGGFVLFGMSGGTVTNALGQLVCVPEAVFSYQKVPLPGLGFCVPLPTIRTFLNGYKVHK